MFSKKTKEKNKQSQSQTPPSKVMEKLSHIQIHHNQQETIKEIQNIFGQDKDFCKREIYIFGDIPSTVLYLNSIADKECISTDIIKPLTQNFTLGQTEGTKEITNNLKMMILKKVLYHADVNTDRRLVKVIDGILRGKTILLVNGLDEAFLIDTFKTDRRSITQPETEQVIRGPRDGFIEDIRTNTALVRSRLPIPEFRIKDMEIGTLTKSYVAICYIEGIANEALIEDVERRLSSIDVDRILDAGYIEQFIQDNPRSPFPQIKSSERPDVIVGNLVEGRIAILVDGSPFALVAPATFNQFYHTSEDYNERFIMVSLIRMVRLVALLFSLIMPSMYVAVISYHPELIPTAFAVAVTSGRAGVPFPAVVEVFLMESAMEILREATVRMPKQVGGAISIVGVLVVGQAAVEAGFVSPITVVVIALTSIGSFATPAYNVAIGFRMMRFPLLILTGIFGFYGLMIGLLFITNHVLSLKSFGVPYLSPIAPLNFGGLKDTIFRAPLNWLLDRPEELQTQNQRRINPHDSYPNNPLLQKNKQKSGQLDE
ncbi:spore germination protein [Lysinibacillus sp. PLM2]|nr:spore germination protein [Lysinibacillus sp. PLM2]